jgi:hypothetical protein
MMSGGAGGLTSGPDRTKTRMVKHTAPTGAARLVPRVFFCVLIAGDQNGQRSGG